MSQVAEKDPKQTRERILACAERLFSERGFDVTSLRTITAEAAVNLAAVNYHFGSKDELVREVLRRRLEPLNRERCAELRQHEAAAGPDGPSLEQILDAFVGPALRLSKDPARGGRVFMRLFGYAMSKPDPELRDFIGSQFHEVASRFKAALQRALPALDEGEIFWRMMFMVGSMAHSMAMSDQLHKISQGLCDPDDTEGIARRLVPFLAAGFRSPLQPSSAEDAG
jgi:AcrR family transcriptional regulator